MGLNRVKPENIGTVGKNWIAKEQEKNKLSAIEVLAKAKELEQQKIASGLYEVVIVQPQYGGSYRTLKRKK